MTYTIAVCTVKNSWWWTEELSETCRVSFQNKFAKLVRLVGFIIRKGHTLPLRYLIIRSMYLTTAESVLKLLFNRSNNGRNIHVICSGWNHVWIIEGYWKAGINIRLDNTTTIKYPISNDDCDEASFRFTNKGIYIYIYIYIYICVCVCMYMYISSSLVWLGVCTSFSFNALSNICIFRSTQW